MSNSKKESTRRGDPVSDMRPLFELQADMCRTLAHPVRLEIIERLKDGEQSGSELVEALGLPKANVSQHLGVLRDAGLVEIRKHGVQIHARLALGEIVDACLVVRRALATRLESERIESERRQNLLLASLETVDETAHVQREPSQAKEERR